MAFIRRGRLFLLFSAASPLGDRQPGEDVPESFEQLHVGPPEVTLSRQPCCLRTNSVQQVWTDLGDKTSTTTHAHSLTSAPAVLENSSPAALENVPFRSRTPGSSFAFELTENRSGAALVTNYETYSANAQDTSPFEEYTKIHYNSWVKFGHDKGYAEDVRPILVTGFDVTRDFEMIAYSDEDTALRSGVVAPDSTVAVSHWVTQQTRSSPHTQRGPWGLGPLPRDRVVEFPPKSTDEGDIPDEFNRCIFVRYYTMRKSPARPPNAIETDPDLGDLVSDDDMLVVTSGSPGQFDVDSAGGGEEDPEGQWDYGSDNDDSDVGFVVHNLPSVCLLSRSFVPALTFAQGRGLRQLEVRRRLRVQGIQSLSSCCRRVTQTFPLEELECCLRFGAPPRFGGNPYCKTNKNGKFQLLTLD